MSATGNRWQPRHVHAVTSAAALLLLFVVSGSTVASAQQAPHDDVITVMPFGDSITTCCHGCTVQAQILPPELRAKYAEDMQPYQGYGRPLWQLLTHHLRSDPTSASSTFQLVGRMRDCIFKWPNGTRATTHDWPVRYEGYYGYTTGRLVAEGIPAAATRAVLNATGSGPRIVLLHAGTNDLIAMKAKNRVGVAQENLRTIVEMLAFGAPPQSPSQLLAPIASGGGAPQSNNNNNNNKPRSTIAASEAEFTCKLLEEIIPELSVHAVASGRASDLDFLRQLRSTRPRRGIILAVPIPIRFTHVWAGARGQSANARGARVRRHAALRHAIVQLFRRLTRGMELSSSSAGAASAANTAGGGDDDAAPSTLAAKTSSPVAEAAPFVLAEGPLTVRRDALRTWIRRCTRSGGGNPAAGGARGFYHDNGDADVTAAANNGGDDAASGIDVGVDFVLVDASAGFDMATDLHGDGLHPTTSGEAKIAARFAAGVQRLLRRWRWVAEATSPLVSDAELDRAAAVAAASHSLATAQAGRTNVADAEKKGNRDPHPHKSQAAGAPTTTASDDDDDVAFPPVLLNAGVLLGIVGMGLGAGLVVVRRWRRSNHRVGSSMSSGFVRR